MEIKILSFAILVSAIIAIIYRQQKNNKMFSVFKPLTTILIIILAFVIHKQSSNTYTSLMIVSLLFALVGDIFLISKKYFLPGLFSFLISHIVFTVGFTSLFCFSLEVLPLLVLILIGALYFNVLRKHLNKMTVPVLIYLTVILVMNWQAVGLVFINQSLVFLALALGSLLFTFSDAILAYDMFKKPFKAAELLILSTYWSAIYIFTLAGWFI